MKFSTLLLGAIVPLVAGWWMWRRREGRARIAAGLAGAAAAAYVLVWAGYGFRFSAAADPGYRLEWEAVAPGSSATADLVLWARDHRLAPEAYLYGLGLASRFSKARLAYFHGEQRFTGWWYWFPAAFLLKTPLAFLGLVGWAAADAWRRARRIGFEAACLAVPVVLYFATSMASRLNIGHRHLLPVYPLLCIGAAGAARFAAAPGWRRVAAIVLLAGCGASFAAATPGYLAYFNVLAGGARGGARWLVDSNLDWGQDLPALGRWMRGNGVSRVDLAYFGTADPRAYGIDYRKVLMVHDFHPAEPAVRPAAGNWLAVSLTLLEGVYVDRDGELAGELVHRGLISTAVTREYLDHRDAAVARGELFPWFYDWVVVRGYVDAARRDEIYAGTLSALLDRLRTTPPDARAGDSIVLFRIR